eukprot:CAMPEP_0175054332 /NCGR_PEP_ID=MMETSP0052_2-20121109/9445_1 /TAXON_ID=51329 ORGANISM="Polytomella parva, Strain SAG 63-3" /NCGR_SAMPLE_ID=MMETSP0052_2 /ASSEMBLY_ACC=CAM_ASM_000194 /LENGTH=473 /DNA_ID=CAMNT_0016319013 /DNA_START=89 /DNA_END=1506 /DNA_ORIENTATION=-
MSLPGDGNRMPGNKSNKTRFGKKKSKSSSSNNNYVDETEGQTFDGIENVSIRAFTPSVSSRASDIAKKYQSSRNKSSQLPSNEVDIEQNDINEGTRLTKATLSDINSSDESFTGYFWRGVMYLITIGPWQFIKGLAWILNRWQQFLSPLSRAMFYAGDTMDRSAPSLRAFIVWIWNSLSLALHFVDVILTFVVMNILSRHNHRGLATVMGFLYALSHYLMAVIMYMELDRPKQHHHYGLLDFLRFIKRQFDVLCYDVQLLASVIHSNSMVEGTTQLLLQGYSEARVALHMLMNSIPVCFILGLFYDAVFTIKDDVSGLLSHKASLGVISATFLLAVFNVVEKFCRLSFADPWLHFKHVPHHPRSKTGPAGGEAIGGGGGGSGNNSNTSNTNTNNNNNNNMNDPNAPNNSSSSANGEGVVNDIVGSIQADETLDGEAAYGYPLLYVRSHAARLPRALVLDFLFRCCVSLEEEAA